MPFTSLNKVISLFLVGAVSLGLIFAFGWLGLSDNASKFDPKAWEHWIGLLSFAAIVLAFIVGLVVNAIANRLIRRIIIFRAARSRRGARLFLAERDHLAFESWKAWFAEAAKDHPVLRRKPASLPDSEAESKQLATAICIQHGTSQGFEWMTSHFAMHYFASDVAFLLLAGCAVPIKLAAAGSISIYWLSLCVVFLIISSYFTLCFSLGQYLYTYTFAFRVATLYLSEYHPGAEQSIGSHSHPDDTHTAPTTAQFSEASQFQD